MAGDYDRAEQRQRLRHPRGDVDVELVLDESSRVPDVPGPETRQVTANSEGGGGQNFPA